MLESQLILGDCLEHMSYIPDGSIDMVLCDLPYGQTQNKWDCLIPFGELWTHYKRVCKETAAIVLFAQTPFDKIAGMSNLSWLKYEWIWRKPIGTGHLNAKKSPLKNHENILVFYKKPPTYNPVMREGKPYVVQSGRGSSNYNKQESVLTVNTGERYPLTVLDFNHDKVKLHPTQKPLALCEYLIKTYTNSNEVVLDNTMGSGTTCLAARNLDRRFIGIEKDEKYFEIAKTRL